KEAFEIANKFSWNKKELEHYDRILMREMDDVLVEEKRKNDLESAIRKAVMKAVNETETKAEIKAKQEKIEIAKSLLDILDIETIALKTKLSIEEVAKLKN
ncbi:MAG: hypothetical protein U9P38_03085, partial [Campylobacterota bacterium]|nr:hypothetical protein [Campylobacterota bacterium]